MERAKDRLMQIFYLQAFAAHVRAYATHARETKTIFNVRALHLGHVASSFGLRTTPADVAKLNSGV
jgi:ATP-dependent RNA helicase DDX31/DBP7